MSYNKEHGMFGEPAADNTIVNTTGRVIRPFRRMVTQVADEYRLHWTDDGLSVSVIDSSRVMLIDATISASVFDGYQTEETVVGVSDDMLGTVLQHARYGKSTDDPITLRVSDDHIVSEVDRPLGETDATIAEQIETINPESIREEPDLPDTEYEATVELPPNTLIEAVKVFDTGPKTGAVIISVDDGTLRIQQESEFNAKQVEMGIDTDATVPETYFGADYLEKMATALTNGYVGSVTVKMREEYPITVGFEREDVFSGEIMIAPRVKEE